MVSSRNRKPPCGKKLVWQRLCTMRRLLCLYANRPLRELSGLATKPRKHEEDKAKFYFFWCISHNAAKKTKRSSISSSCFRVFVAAFYCRFFFSNRHPSGGTV